MNINRDESSKYFIEFLDRCLLEKLTERQKRICMWRTKDILGIGANEKTYKEIGILEGISWTRVGGIKTSIIMKIKHRIKIINQRMGEPQVVIKYIEAEKMPEAQANLPIVYKPISALGEMSIRAANCLHNDEIKTVEQLITKTEAEILKLPNFGRKSLNELRELLKQQGLRFGMDV